MESLSKRIPPNHTQFIIQLPRHETNLIHFPSNISPDGLVLSGTPWVWQNLFKYVSSHTASFVALMDLILSPSAKVRLFTLNLTD